MPTEELLHARTKDLAGGLMVRRLLPTHPRQAVGPFVFFDHFGPVTAQPGDDHDVRPHPHIGLATVTYLFDGAMLHRDSLGSIQRIEPGAINWMTAGRGIVHSERTPPDLRGKARPVHGLQLWAALPAAHEECAPGVRAHAGRGDSRMAGRRRARAGADRRSLRRALAGRDLRRDAVLDLAADAGGTLVLPAAAAGFERAAYSVDAPLLIDGREVAAHTLAVLEPGAGATIVAPRGARYVILGGEPLDGRRFIHWNFVSSRRERIEQAKADWQAQRMGRVDGEDDFVPLP